MTWLTPRVTATPRQVASDHLVEPSSSAPPFTAFIDRAQVVAGYLSLGEFASGLEAFLELLPRLPRTRSAAERHVMQNVCAQLVARVARAVDDRHRVDLLKAWSSSTLSDEHEDVRRVLGAIAAAYGTSFAPPSQFPHYVILSAVPLIRAPISPVHSTSSTRGITTPTSRSPKSRTRSRDR